MEAFISLHQCAHHRPANALALELGMHQHVREVNHEVTVGYCVAQADQPPGDARRDQCM